MRRMTPDGPPLDRSPGAPTTITITTGRPAALVAFHDVPRFNPDRRDLHVNS
jgi:hypothetical protein